MPKVTQYETESGSVPFKRWFDSLGAKAALKVRTAAAQMEAGNPGDHKSVGGGVWERRVNFEKGYRIYYGKVGDELVILLLGGTKSRQQADIEKARRYWSDYKKRKSKSAKKQNTKTRSPAAKRKK